jgi:predicted AlkP superfamily phosphohydrolase/phosphomutase
MAKTGKVLIIGVDGATFDLIEPWVSEGKLPALAGLLEGGAHGILRSAPNTNSASAWVSFATGNNPGKHGIFYFDEPIFGTYRRRYLNGSFRKSKAIWNYASASGKKVGVMNIPMSYPAEPVNGFMIAGIDSPETWGTGFIYPQGLARHLRSTLGDYIIEPGIPQFIKAGKRRAAVDILLRTVETRQRYAKHLMGQFPWDLFIVVFTASDAVQHFFWKDMDVTHPEHTEDGASRYGDSILKIYQKIDQAISDLLNGAGDATVFIISDHGAGFNQRGAEYLNPWLSEIGLLKYNGNQAWKKIFIRPVQALYDFIDKHISREAKLRLIRHLPGMREKVEAATVYQHIDWSGTKAYSDGARDEIWINLKEREPKGTVQPGDEYERVRDRVIENLMKAKDIQNGERVVRKVYRREEVYSGKHVPKAPDLLVQWRQDFVIGGLTSGESRACSGRGAGLGSKPPLLSGGHRENGIAIIRGPQTKKAYDIGRASIIDVAPTVLYLLGLPIPREMDGRILQELIDEEQWREHPPVYQAIDTEHQSVSEEEYSREEKKKISKKLKGMGYID